MKKGIAVVLIFVLGLGVLAGCGGGGSSTNNDAPADNGQEAPVAEAPVVLAPYTVDMTTDEMWETYKAFSADKNLSEISYEMLVELFGVEAELSAEDSTDKNDWYQWYANDTGGLIVLFSKDTGKFVSASMAYPNP